MDTSNIITCTKTIAGREVTLETGKVARQATASVIASSGDTQVLVTVVAGGQKPGQSFFPLTVNYIEKFYAAGKIPGSFFRREGRMIGTRPRFSFGMANYNARMGGGAPNLFSSADFSDGRITDVLKVQQLLKQFQNQGQEQVGVDPRNLKNGLAGIFAQNGYANITRLDGNGALIKERKQVWVVTEKFTVSEKRPIPGTGRRGFRFGRKGWNVEPDYETVTVQKTRKIIVMNNPGDPAPSGPNILSASRANSNGGRLPGSNLGQKRGLFGRSRQTSKTTLDRRSPVETFCTNPNVLKVADTARGKGEPILEVNKK